MTISASDDAALFDLIETDVAELKKKLPDHPLLKFADGVLKSNWTPEIGEEFLSLFDTTGKDTIIQVRVGYWNALKKALGKETKPKESEPPKVTRLNYDEEDYPAINF